MPAREIREPHVICGRNSSTISPHVRLMPSTTQLSSSGSHDLLNRRWQKVAHPTLPCATGPARRRPIEHTLNLYLYEPHIPLKVSFPEPSHCKNALTVAHCHALLTRFLSCPTTGSENPAAASRGGYSHHTLPQTPLGAQNPRRTLPRITDIILP